MLLAVLCMLVLAMQHAAAQEQKHLVQLSGFVTLGDSLAGTEGVAVYVPQRNQGILTQQNGFFSIPVFTGDSVVFSALGYQKQYLVIPKNLTALRYTANIQLQENPKELPTVDVMPWATEHDFKQAVLGLKLPTAPSVNIDVGSANYKSILDAPPMDATGNFRHFQQQQVQQRQRTYLLPSIIRLLSIPIK